MQPCLHRLCICFGAKKCVVHFQKKGDHHMKYNKWLNEWLKNTVKPMAKASTFARYKGIAEVHILPKLGEREINELTPLVLQKFVAELLQRGNSVTGKGLAPNSVNTIITVVQNSLKSAAVFGELNEYTADKIKRPQQKESEVGCFSLAEQRQIEKEVRRSKKDKMFGIILCLYSGLRIGELLALTWRDIDYSNGTVTISKSCHYGRGEDGKFARQTDLPKTITSYRIIPLPRQLLFMLKALEKRSTCEYIIANGRKPISVRSFQRSFSRLLKRLNIPHKGFHALRHTFATRAVECGMDVKTLSELLGHKNASITINRYAHSLIEHKKEMMNKLGKLLQ